MIICFEDITSLSWGEHPQSLSCEFAGGGWTSVVLEKQVNYPSVVLHGLA